MTPPGMMGCRYQLLQSALAGYQKTGIPFVAYTPSGGFSPAGITDDKGIYFFIPKIAETFHLNLDQSITAFYLGMMLFAFMLSLTGAMLYFKSWPSRILFTLCSYTLAAYSFQVSDVYMMATAITIATIPLFLYFFYHNKSTIYFLSFLILCGIFTGASQYIRSFSSIPIIIFIFLMLVTDKSRPFKIKTPLLSAFVGSLLVCLAYFNYLIYDSNQYLKNNVANYTSNQAIDSHPTWHSIYIGLGYYPNNYGISYQDTVALEKAKTVDKNVVYLSKEYEQILRTETFHFIQNHLQYFFQISLKKSAETFALLHSPHSEYLTGNLTWALFLMGELLFLVLLFFTKNFINLHLAFLLAILLSMTPGVLVVPATSYLLGFISLAYVYIFVLLGLNIDQAEAYLRHKYSLFKLKQYPIEMPEN